MSKLAIVGTVHFPREQRDRVLPLLLAHRDRCLNDEPGTLQFEVLAPRGDDTKLLLYEVYRDDAAFEAHRNGPSIARWRLQTAAMGIKIDIVQCTPADGS